MFEEVPAERRGISRLTARRFVLGPFIVGGGVVLCMIGGSAALAATVITASTIVSDDRPPHSSHQLELPPASSAHPVAKSHVTGVGPTHGAPGASTVHSVGQVPSAARSTSIPASKGATVLGPPISVTAPAPTTTATTESPAPSSGQPTGNALVYLAGYDRGTKLFSFSYAVAVQGDSGTTYHVDDPKIYSAALASDAKITSGSTLCPPAGSTCTADQLINAVAGGLYAEVAIGAGGNFELVTELQGQSSGAPQFAPTAPSPTSTPSSSPTG